MMDIATCNLENHCHSTVCRCIKKFNLKLYYAKRKPFIYFVQKVIGDGPKDGVNMFTGLTSPHFHLFLGKTDIGCAKDEKDHPDCCLQMAVHQCPRHGWSAYMCRYHWCRGLCWNFGKTNAAVKMTTFPRKSMCISAGQSQASFCTIPTASLCKHWVPALDWLPAVQICLLLKVYGASWRGESDNGDHGLLSSSSLVHTRNRQKLHLQNCNN